MHEDLKNYASIVRLFQLFFSVSPSVSSSELASPRWFPPLKGHLKINCDTVVSNSGAAIACVVRDALGSVFDGFAHKIHDSPSVLLAEALAIPEACILC